MTNVTNRLTERSYGTLSGWFRNNLISDLGNLHVFLSAPFFRFDFIRSSLKKGALKKVALIIV